MWSMPEPEQYDEFGRPVLRRPAMPEPVSNAVAPPTAAPVQAPFAPAQITPAAPGPAEMVYSNTLNSQPRREDYQRGRGEKILDAIAAGFAGASGGAKVGMDTAERLNPYTRAKERWQERLAALAPQVQMEQSRYGHGVEAAKLGTEQSAITASGKQAEAKMQQEKTVEEERIRHDKTTEMIQEMRVAKKSEVEIEMAVARTDPEFYKNFNAMRHPKESLEDTLKKFDAQEKIRLKYAPQIAGADAAARQAVTNQAPLSEDTQTAIDSMVQNALKDPDSIWDMEKYVPGGQKGKAHYLSQVMAQLDSIPTQLDPIQRRTRDAAKTAILHATTLQGMLEDPEIKSKIGPISGRLAKLNQLIGSEVFNQSDEGSKAAMLDRAVGTSSSQKESEFMTLMKYLILFEASNVTGSRPSWQLIHYLESTQGMQFDYDKMKANLNMAIKAAQLKLQGVYGPSNKGVPPSGTKDKPAAGFNWGNIKINQ